MGKFWRILPWVILVLTLGWSGYTLLDQGVTIAYHEDEMGRLKKQRDFLALVSQAGLVRKSKAEVGQFLKARNIEYFEKGESLIAEEVEMLFSKDRLVKLGVE